MSPKFQDDNYFLDNLWQVKGLTSLSLILSWGDLFCPLMLDLNFLVKLNNLKKLVLKGAVADLNILTEIPQIKELKLMYFT
jgi:hypothetical protein